jgi:hypothetical protein
MELIDQSSGVEQAQARQLSDTAYGVYYFPAR